MVARKVFPPAIFLPRRQGPGGRIPLHPVPPPSQGIDVADPWGRLCGNRGGWRCILAAACGVLMTVAVAAAQDVPSSTRQRPHFEMEEIVVTASGLDDEVQQTPKNVTVITSDDIAQASSNNVVDLLAREANVNLRSLYGHDKNAGIDIRGQGITSTNNVLVYVDGFRLNPPDLAGPDLSSVPLDQIERIEILRGAGSVIYGDGAVGGVVNITTRKPSAPFQGQLSGSTGSYDTVKGRASVEGRKHAFNYSLNAGHYDTDGYRENGYYRRTTFQGTLGWEGANDASASFLAAYKGDAQGFSGGVPKADIDDRDKRRETSSPGDFGEGAEVRLAGTFESALAAWGDLTLSAGYRSRGSDFVLGYTDLKSIAQQKSWIDERTATASVGIKKPYRIFDKDQQIHYGVDLYATDYVTERPDQLTRKNSRINSLGVFALNRGDLLPDLVYTLGGRYNMYRGTFRNDDLKSFAGGAERWVNGTPFERNWDNTAVDAGLVYTINDQTSVFTSYATSFRIPNVDELALAASDLTPQSGSHVDIGLRRMIDDAAEVSLTYFYILTKNEIYFDNINNINDNYADDTARQGLEVDVRAYPADVLYLWGNATLMSAKFTGSGATVPLVPEFTATIGAEWQATDALVFSVTGNYVGPKYDGNDLTNQRYDQIRAYTVVDGKLTYTVNAWVFMFGINNVFDALYETTAFSETDYTMPTRNFYGGVQWAF